MLSLSEKIDGFFESLAVRNGSYGDTIREEIEFYFSHNDKSFDFLEKFNTLQEINDFCQIFVSKIILHEHEDGLNNIIEYYCH